jgi:L-cysteine/cystine lyase
MGLPRCPDGMRRPDRYDTDVVSPFLPDPEKVAALRAQLPATGAGIYLNAGSAGPLPAETQAAMDEQAAMELAVGRASPPSFLAFFERMAEVRAAVAAILVADPDDIALTHSTTDGLNMALGGIRWRPGDRVLTTNHEHPGVLGPLASLRHRFDLQVEVLDIGDGGDHERTMEVFAAALERPTRAVVLSHALWTTGAVLPVERLGPLAHAAGALVIIDGAQSAGAIPLAMPDLDVDAYAVPGQKWLLGPEGMGALWARRSFAEQAEPLATAYLSYASLPPDVRNLQPNARRFEGTGFHRPSVVGLGRSAGWLSMYVGIPWATGRATRLAAAAHQRLASIPGVEMVTPAGHGGTLVSFRIAGWPAADASKELTARVFAIIRDLPALDALRISIGFWTTEEELERFARAVELLAAHTPETIPARRTLAVLGSDGEPLT